MRPQDPWRAIGVLLFWWAVAATVATIAYALFIGGVLIVAWMS